MTDQSVRNHIARQYRAALAMLGQAIETCPDSLWLATEYPNKFWHIAYHALFYTHLYLQPTEAEFVAWAKHVPNSQYLGPRPWVPQDAPVVMAPYARTDVLEYHKFCCAEAEVRVPAAELDAASGFSWLPFNKLELQFYNIRHVQHHAGQLADRLRTACGLGVGWVRPD